MHSEKVLSGRKWILARVEMSGPVTEEDLKEFVRCRMQGEGLELDDFSFDVALTSLASESKICRPPSRFWKN